MMKMGIRISHTAKVWPSNGSLLMNETPTFKQKCGLVTTDSWARTEFITFMKNTHLGGFNTWRFSLHQCCFLLPFHSTTGHYQKQEVKYVFNPGFVLTEETTLIK